MPDSITDYPPIFTADNRQIAVGDVLYGVDTKCSNGAFPTVTPLQVLQLDLASRRQVRLRKEDGVEWVWSPNQTKGECRSRENLLFSSYSSARNAAVTAAENFGESEDAKEIIKDFERAKRDYEEARVALAELNKTPNTFKKRIAALKKSKPPKPKFSTIKFNR